MLTMNKEIFSKTMLTLAAGASLLLGTGCATKNHVRNEMQPVVNKVNELDDLTAKNTNGIRDVDARAQQGIAGVNSKAGEADQKAAAARQSADQAQQLASCASTRVDALGNTVANLDNYKPVAEASIHFAFNSADLSKKAKAALDDFAANLQNAKGYIVQLEGGTDSVGDQQYNYSLSERRVAAVRQYLASKYDVPAHKIYVIGLGEDKAVADNKSSKGRAENRRVEVRLMSNVTDAQPQQPSQTSQNQNPR